MKREIHPEMHEVEAYCVCGNTFKTLSTQAQIRTTLCSSCHPFFTGQEKFVDTEGRIDKFNKKYKKNA